MAKKQVATGQEAQANLPPLPKMTAPKLLPWWKAWGLALLLPMCLASFVASIIGLYVLTGKPAGAHVASMPLLPLSAEPLFADEQNDNWISRSFFGQHYKILVSTNAAWSPFFFNGGLVGFVYCCIQLHRHRKALQVCQFASWQHWGQRLPTGWHRHLSRCHDAVQIHRFLQRVRIERAPQSTGNGTKKLR